MKEQVKLFLDWALPFLCLANLFLYWDGGAVVVTAWVVATAGWTTNLFHRYKKYDNN
jgi:hypothetical protein